MAPILAWYGGAITLNDYLGNEKDVRSFDMPRWMLMASIPLSFGMMAIEFLRFLWRGESPVRRRLVPTSPKSSAWTWYWAVALALRL